MQMTHLRRMPTVRVPCFYISCLVARPPYPQEERQREADTERNRGVYLAAQLQAIDADENAAIARGIKRNSDKVRATW